MISLPVSAGISQVLHLQTYGDCELTISHDTVVGFDGVIIIRFRTKDYKPCLVSKEKLSENLDKALQYFKSNKLTEVTSVFLGGKLSSYPWMTEYLISRSKVSNEWNSILGKPISGHANTYVSKVLNSDTILKPFLMPLSKHQYEIMGIDCEKIMINSDKLPYDGLCWISIKNKISIP